ncbi:PhoX family phosphatase [Microbacterium paludicola]|uniref:PhoX family phosphatase n=1 Tax=Microbacterium paludicola TaxID=300019 RepID=A0A4Y9FRV9_9MICO|nr:PhoX family phosphatase [Microbacterium paludicola]TFU30978.1 PhoX family phosphatase [Microbacterium paludicola]
MTITSPTPDAVVRPEDETRRRPLLNLLMTGRTHGKRSPVTCMYKCDNACFHPVPNTSDNAYFRDIADAALSRRAVLAGGAAAAGAIVLSGVVGGGDPASAATAQVVGRGGGRAFGFEPIAAVPAEVDAVTVPQGFRWTPIIRWGDPLFDRRDTFDPNSQTAQKQARQFGYNNDYLDIIVEKNGREALLVANQEYTNAGIMFPPAADEEERLEQLRVSKAAHGMAVVELERGRKGDTWKYRVGGRRNRRITADTRMVFSGPAAGSDLLKTVEDPEGRYPVGTFGNCAGGTTPWGTVLSGEENFNGYFRATGTSPEHKRYGLSANASSYGWEAVDPRFDARQPGYENEPNRFGWIVEIDPENPDEPPVKHTALGRLKHEGANVSISRSGHAVAYMGDDERFDYLYKFVSTDRYKPGNSRGARAHNKTLLSKGSLYVAKFSGDSPLDEITGTGALPSDGSFDGSGEWVALMRDGESAVPGFTVEQVLVNTRLAADAVGATKMDRCEDVEPHPQTGRVYVACTNNTDRGKVGKEGATEVNPRNSNRDGHVIEITESHNDATSTRFGWSILLLCGDPSTNPNTYFAGFPADKVSPISCPDNITFDSAGNLWISTDGQPGTIGYNDGLFRVPLAGPERGRVQQFLSVPRDGETCGPVVHDEEGSVFVAVQHPGEEGRWAAQNSYFPDYIEPGALRGGKWGGPRPSVIQVTRA